MDKKNIESIFPLTSIQKGLLFHALKDGEAGGYTGRHCLYLKGNIDVDAFKKSIDRLNQKYDIFPVSYTHLFARDEVQLLTKDRKVLRVKKNQEGAKAIYDAICGGDCLTIHSREPNLEEIFLQLTGREF